MIGSPFLFLVRKTVRYLSVEQSKEKVCALYINHLKELIKLRYDSIKRENKNEK